MKKLLVFIIVIGLLVLGAWKIGWLKISDESKTTTMTVDKEKVKDDLNKLGEKTKDDAGKAGELLKEGAQKGVDAFKTGAEKVKDETKQLLHKNETTTTTTTETKTETK